MEFKRNENAMKIKENLKKQKTLMKLDLNKLSKIQNLAFLQNEEFLTFEKTLEWIFMIILDTNCLEIIKKSIELKKLFKKTSFSLQVISLDLPHYYFFF